MFAQLRERIRRLLHRSNPPTPECELPWDFPGPMNQLGDFTEFIEQKFNMVKRQSSKTKYYAKIGLQALIFIINLLELIFTLGFGDHNQLYNKEELKDDLEVEMYKIPGNLQSEELDDINDTIVSAYQGAYIISIIFCVLMHCFVWCYIYKYKQTKVNNIFMEIFNFIIYIFIGGLSYFKLAPFIYYFTRNKKISSFSFSQINKYLLMTDDDRFRNPTGLFKERNKPVNIFRNLIFHRISLLSMMITLMLQTIPQMFIQGFFCTAFNRWDAYNVFSILFLIISTLYSLTELQLMVFTTSYRAIQSELQFKLQKVQLKRIQETKQLLKSNPDELKQIQGFYFHIDPRNFTLYEKRRCMIQILKFLLAQKQFSKLELLYVDHYEDVLIKFLANYFKFSKVSNIRIHCENEQGRIRVQDIINGKKVQNEPGRMRVQNSISQNNIQNQRPAVQNNIVVVNPENIQNSKIECLICSPEQLKQWWNQKEEEIVDEEALRAQVIQINEPEIIDQPRSGIQQVVNIQRFENFLPINADYRYYIPQDFLKLLPPIPMLPRQITFRDRTQIILEAQQIIIEIPRSMIIRETLGYLQFLANIVDFYLQYSATNFWQHIQEFINSTWNISLTIVQIVYISESGPFSVTLTLVQIFIPLLQIASFTFFYFKIYPQVPLIQKIPVILLFSIFNFIRAWDYMMIVLYLYFRQKFPVLKVPFSSDAYNKFKSYASRFKGTLAIMVFQYPQQAVNPNSVLDIRKLPFYYAVTWRASVEETLLKVIQFTIYILSLVQGLITGTLIFSIIQSLKEGLVSIWSMISVLLKDYLIPALVLRDVSVDQFFQSFQFLGSISQHIYIEFPMSFGKFIKAKQEYIEQNCSILVEVKNLNFQNYQPLKLKKTLAQMRLTLCSVRKLIEFNSAQKFFSMGPEIHDIFECIKASYAPQMKFNFYLEEVDPSHANHINPIIQICPDNLQFLQIQIEHSRHLPLSLRLERAGKLTAFQYSYLQIKRIVNQQERIAPENIIHINQEFLTLDRYDFQQFYFEVAGFLELAGCHEFLGRFSNARVYRINIKNDNQIQNFNLNINLTSQQKQIIDLTLENLILNTAGCDFKNIKKFRLILRKCRINVATLTASLNQLPAKGEVFIDMKKQDQSNRFTIAQQRDLVKQLQNRSIQTKILLPD